MFAASSFTNAPELSLRSIVADVHLAMWGSFTQASIANSTVVGMDVKQMRVATGLLHARGTRSFTSEADDLGNVDSGGDLSVLTLLGVQLPQTAIRTI